jgi:hypothetical protein
MKKSLILLKKQDFFMPKNYKKLYIGILIAICLSAVLLIMKPATPEIKNGKQEETPIVTFPAPVTSQKIEKDAINKTTQEETAPSKNTEKVTVLAGEIKIDLSVPPNTIFYDALVDAQSEGKITFSGKKYTALGFFVTDIGTLHAGDGKDLLYYVNGKEATVGVSQYVLKNGDIVEWKLE